MVGLSPEYQRMRWKVRALYPTLSYGQITYMCNLIGNQMRSLHTDMYDVWLQKSPFDDVTGYYADLYVEADLRHPSALMRFLGYKKKCRIWIRIAVD